MQVHEQEIGARPEYNAPVYSQITRLESVMKCPVMALFRVRASKDSSFGTFLRFRTKNASFIKDLPSTIRLQKSW